MTKPMTPGRTGLSRRDLLKYAGLGAGTALSASLGLSQLARAAGADPVDLALATWSGTKKVAVEALLERFLVENENVTGQVIEDAARFEKLAASFAIDASQPFANLLQHNAQRFAEGAVADLWDVLDPARIPNLSLLDQRFQPADRKGAFWITDLEGIVYNKRLISTPPQSWYDLFDPKYKGLASFGGPNFAINGVSIIAQLEGDTSKDYSGATKLYAEAAAAGQFGPMISSGAQLRQLFQTDQIAIAYWFQGIVQPWIDEGDEIGFVVPKEGPVLFPEGWQLVRGLEGRSLDVASSLFNEIISPDLVTEYATLNPVIPLVEGAVIPERYRDLPSYSRDVLENGRQIDWTAHAENVPDALALWNATVTPNL